MQAKTLRIDGAYDIAQAYSALNELFKQIDDDGSQEVVIEMESPARLIYPSDLQMLTRWEKCLRHLERAAFTSIAVAKGVCSQAALDLLLAADFRVADTAMMADFRFEQAQIWPGMALYRLVNLVGRSNCRRVFASDNAISAQDLLSLGIVDDIAADTQAAAERYLRCRDDSSGQRMLMVRQLMAEANHTEFEEALGAHIAACGALLKKNGAK